MKRTEPDNPCAKTVPAALTENSASKSFFIAGILTARSLAVKHKLIGEWNEAE
jgi:hypothetical protein